MTAAEVNDFRDVGGNVKLVGAAASVASNADITVTDTTNGATRTGKAAAEGSFGPLNVKGVVGDTIQIVAGSQTCDKTVS
jgi:hypothetical protein